MGRGLLLLMLLLGLRIVSGAKARGSSSGGSLTRGSFPALRESGNLKGALLGLAHLAIRADRSVAQRKHAARVLVLNNVLLRVVGDHLALAIVGGNASPLNDAGALLTAKVISNNLEDLPNSGLAEDLHRLQLGIAWANGGIGHLALSLALDAVSADRGDDNFNVGADLLVREGEGRNVGAANLSEAVALVAVPLDEVRAKVSAKILNVGGQHHLLLELASDGEGAEGRLRRLNNLIEDAAARLSLDAVLRDGGVLHGNNPPHVVEARAEGVAGSVGDRIELAALIVVAEPLASALALNAAGIRRLDGELSLLDGIAKNLNVLASWHASGDNGADVADDSTRNPIVAHRGELRLDAVTNVLETELVALPRVLSVDGHLLAVRRNAEPRKGGAALGTSAVLVCDADALSLGRHAKNLKLSAGGLAGRDGSRDIKVEEIIVTVYVGEHLGAEAEANVLAAGGVGEGVLGDETEAIVLVAAHPANVKNSVRVIVVGLIGLGDVVHVALTLSVLGLDLILVGDALLTVNNVSVLVIASGEIEGSLEEDLAVHLAALHGNGVSPLVHGADDKSLRGLSGHAENDREEEARVEDLGRASLIVAAVLKAQVELDGGVLSEKVAVRVLAGEADGKEGKRLILIRLALAGQKELVGGLLNIVSLNDEAFGHAEDNLAAVVSDGRALGLLNGASIDGDEAVRREGDRHAAVGGDLHHGVADEVEGVKAGQLGVHVEGADLVVVEGKEAKVGQVVEPLKRLNLVVAHAERLQISEAVDSLERINLVAREVEVAEGGDLGKEQEAAGEHVH